MSKYFTIVIRADDEKSARALVPGEKIGPNTITACSMGDVIDLNERIKEIVPAEWEDDIAAAERKNLSEFFPCSRLHPPRAEDTARP